MGQLAIEAFEDRSRAEGGHAVILLTGLREVPSRPAFRLRPAGLQEDSELPFAWPEGELLPATAKVTGRGVEFVVGPDIAENPLLTAGSAIEIRFVDADISGEFLWPSIQPIARPKRRSLVARVPQRDDRLDAPRASERPTTGGSATSPVAQQPLAKPAALAPVAVAPRTQASRTPASSSEQIPRSDETEMADNAHDVGTAIREPATPNARKRDSAEFVTFYPHARGGRLKTEKGPGPFRTAKLAAFMPSTPGGVGVAIVAGVVLVQGIWLLVSNGQIPNPAASIAAIERTTATGPPADTLFEALVSGTTSPRSVNARDVSGVRALETAQTLLLAPDGSRDTEEGAFWLKRYLQGAIGDERTLRALTHLGSSYAEPSGRPPDYAKARLVWEMAGALGDPVALCLLGVVHENGLGGSRDKKNALLWYERAKKAGGCPDIDESIARVRQ